MRWRRNAPSRGHRLDGIRFSNAGTGVLFFRISVSEAVRETMRQIFDANGA
jgi:hypothetical protein